MSFATPAHPHPPPLFPLAFIPPFRASSIFLRWGAKVRGFWPFLLPLHFSSGSSFFPPKASPLSLIPFPPLLRFPLFRCPYPSCLSSPCRFPPLCHFLRPFVPSRFGWRCHSLTPYTRTRSRHELYLVSATRSGFGSRAAAPISSVSYLYPLPSHLLVPAYRPYYDRCSISRVLVLCGLVPLLPVKHTRPPSCGLTPTATFDQRKKTSRAPLVSRCPSSLSFLYSPFSSDRLPASRAFLRFVLHPSLPFFTMPPETGCSSRPRRRRRPPRLP